MTGISILFSSGSHVVDNVAIALASVAIICFTTRLFTECRYWLQSRGSAGRFVGREPLTLPYSVPWLGNMFRMLDPHAMYNYALTMSADRRPVKLRVGPVGIYIMFGSKNMKTIFRNSKVLTKEASSMLVFKNSDMKEEDLELLRKDRSGFASTPLIDMPEEKRLWRNTHEVGAAMLGNGTAINVLTSKFVDTFAHALNQVKVNENTAVPIYDFFKRVMFTGSATALLGTEIFKLNPDLPKLYWDYDDAFLLTAIGFPKFLYWNGYRARDRFLAATKKWIKAAAPKYDNINPNTEWEESYGSKFTRMMVKALEDGGMSQDGCASAMLSVIWAINSNAIPCAVWILIEALKHPGVLQRLREEVIPITITDKSGNLNIDMPRMLAECPLLASMYLECMRTRGSVTVFRKFTEDLECDGYALKKGMNMMGPSWLPNHDTIWNVPGHPAKEFWPERFIEMPKIKSENPDEKSQYEMAMKPENFFPYGGGNMICTGRFFAKQEIMAAVTVFLLKLDIEPQRWVTHKGKKSDRAARPDEGFAGSGILPPDRDMLVKLKRRPSI